jgi:hypothetical protein
MMMIDDLAVPGTDIFPEVNFVLDKTLRYYVLNLYGSRQSFFECYLCSLKASSLLMRKLRQAALLPWFRQPFKIFSFSAFKATKSKA